MIDAAYIFGAAVLAIELCGAAVLILIGNLQGQRNRATEEARLHASAAAREYSERRRVAGLIAGYERTSGLARVEAVRDYREGGIMLRIRFAGGVTLGCEVPIHMIRQHRDVRYAARHAAGMVAEAVMDKIEPEIALAITKAVR